MKKSIGLADVKPPEKACQDQKCGWHSGVALRGQVFRGIVTSAKAHKTAVIERSYHRYDSKYERYEKRKSGIAAHNPDCIKAKEGDSVIAVECRPLSKSKSFVIVGIVSGKIAAGKAEAAAEKPKKAVKKTKKV